MAALRGARVGRGGLAVGGIGSMGSTGGQRSSCMCRLAGGAPRTALGTWGRRREARLSSHADARAGDAGRVEWDCSSFFRSSTPSPVAKVEVKEEDASRKQQSAEVLLVANAPLPSSDLLEQLWCRASLRVCADGGANRLYDLNPSRFTPDYVVGDMDSVRPSVSFHYQQAGSKITKSEDQDTTDLHKCLDVIAGVEQQQRKKFEVINILGGLGGNFSHELANVNTLYLFKHRRMFLFSDQNIAFLLQPGTHIIRARVPGSEIRRIFCGLIPMGGRCNTITTKGLRWNLRDGVLEFGGMVSTSNEVAADQNEVEVTVSDPVLWTFDSRPEAAKVHG